jgi:hypothetical protein
MEFYDVTNHPGTDQERFSWFASQPWITDLKRLLRKYGEHIPINGTLFRARSGGIRDSSGLIGLPYQLAADYAQHPQRPAGRANFHGEACVYCADAVETALNEVRATLGESVSVCEFRTAVKLRIVNLEVKRENSVGSGIVDQVFNYLVFRMAEPVEGMPKSGIYVATQMIAELCRAEGFDGLSYTSVVSGSGKKLLCSAQIPSVSTEHS